VAGVFFLGLFFFFCLVVFLFAVTRLLPQHLAQNCRSAEAPSSGQAARVFELFRSGARNMTFPGGKHFFVRRLLAMGMMWEQIPKEAF